MKTKIIKGKQFLVMKEMYVYDYFNYLSHINATSALNSLDGIEDKTGTRICLDRSFVY